jgi:hypothetical protein
MLRLQELAARETRYYSCPKLSAHPRISCKKTLRDSRTCRSEIVVLPQTYICTPVTHKPNCARTNEYIRSETQQTCISALAKIDCTSCAFLSRIVLQTTNQVQGRYKKTLLMLLALLFVPTTCKRNCYRKHEDTRDRRHNKHVSIHWLRPTARASFLARHRPSQGR